jgi:hypothetical protein
VLDNNGFAETTSAATPATIGLANDVPRQAP